LGKKEFLLLCGSILIALIIAEMTLRSLGWQPGQLQEVSYFQPVDSLFVKSGFVADSHGIFKIDATARKTIAKRIDKGKPDYADAESANVFSLAGDNLELMNRQKETALTDLYFSLKKRHRQELSTFQKAIVDYVQAPINKHGFKSIAFEDYGNDEPSVLLLGDSFTWGYSASNLYNSFADHLLAKGYTVYNTGITATDAAQYDAVARRYIPLLEPDYVVVNFYLGNDISYYKRDVKPFKAVFYPTNAGNLMACPHSKYFNTAEQAYDFLLNAYFIPEDGNWFDLFMARTVITTKVWPHVIYLLSFLGIVDQSYLNQDYYENIEKSRYDQPYSNQRLKKIKEIAQQNGAQFLLLSLPEVYHNKFREAEDVPDLFGGLSYKEMDVTKSMYDLEDGHFNDKGHRKYAAFLDSLIRQFERESLAENKEE